VAQVAAAVGEVAKEVAAIVVVAVAVATIRMVTVAEVATVVGMDQAPATACISPVFRHVGELSCPIELYSIGLAS
jgi:hypothetical protein